MIVKDYYKVLEVTPVASLQEIKKSFRRLAVKYHPDKNNGDQLAAARFVEIQEAYEVLSDPQKKRRIQLQSMVYAQIGIRLCTTTAHTGGTAGRFRQVEDSHRFHEFLPGGFSCPLRLYPSAAERDQYRYPSPVQYSKHQPADNKEPAAGRQLHCL